MTRAARWLTRTAIALAVLVGGLFLVAWVLLPSEADLARDVGARFEKATGVALRVGGVQWTLRPTPAIVISDVATAQPAPITVRRIVLYPRLGELWQRRLAVDTIEVDGVVLPSSSVRAFRGRWDSSHPLAAVSGSWHFGDVPVRHLKLRDITWIDRRDIGLAYDADVDFDAGWRPRKAEAWRSDATPEARLVLERQGSEDRWQAVVHVGGGTWSGEAELESLSDNRLHLVARLEAKGVDIAQMLRAFKRRSAVQGTVAGRTVVDAEGESLPQLAGRLHTRTRFSVKPARLDGFDLAAAVRSAGTVRGGQTPLDELVGTLDTQVTPDGTVMRYTDLRARSGFLLASGSATVLNRKLDEIG
ncbi:MAG: hypothetical protein KKC85_00475, partial [Gammaproteobacteria bacterium]|nr:hypothetical protein [Gammaproteobacteria bacterium]